MLLATKWEQWRRHLSPLKLLKFHQDPQIAGIGLEKFVFSLPIFSPALVLIVPRLLPFEMVMYILYQCQKYVIFFYFIGGGS